MELALQLVAIAAKLWPTLADIIRGSSHPDARRVADILPDPGASATVAAELRKVQP